MSDLFLFPVPRSVKRSKDTIALPRQGKIVIPDPKYLFSAKWIQAALREIGFQWQIVTSNPKHDFAIELDEVNLPEQAYKLKVSSDGIRIEGKDAGLFYGLCTLRQLLG